MNKLKRYGRICRRCNNLFKTNREYQKICKKCKKPSGFKVMWLNRLKNKIINIGRGHKFGVLN